MRVAVAGKGGSGKTTISAALARTLARDGYSVVAIDGDPNPNLTVALGVSAEVRDSLGPIPRDLVEEVRDLEGHVHLTVAAPLHEVAERYGAVAPDGVRVLLGSQVERAGAGWLCGAHATVRGLLGGSDVGDREAVVLDMEASLEHMRRGTVRHVETMLVVTEPYFRALETSGRLARLGREMGLGRIDAVANKVRTGEEERAIRDYCKRHDMELAAVIPFDPEVTRADNAGLSLLDAAPNSQAARQIVELSHSLNGRREVV